MTTHTMNHTRMTLGALTLALAAPLALAEAAVPAHPDELSYSEIIFEPPSPDAFRTELNGVPVYLAQTDELPLVTISFSFRGGSYMVAPDKTGLGGMTGGLVRTGGTSTMSPEDLDEEFAFLAANVSAHVGETTSGASINCLSSNLDQAFDIFIDMVRNPGFDADRLEVLRGQAVEGMKQRNDEGMQILLREWSQLMYGPDFFVSREPTTDTINSITEGDMRALHGRIFHPGNLIIAVAGDFDRADMLARLGEALQGWDSAEAAPPVPQPNATYEPGIYYIEKDQPQGQVLIGHRGIKRDHPDAIPVRLMNDILGGGGFTSRITNRVRTDEGLAYVAGSVFRNRVHYDGGFAAYFFSKNPTCALAARTVFEELDKIRDFEVSTDELDTVKNNIIQTFPRTFESKAGTLGVFVNDELTDRPAGFWQSYRNKVDAVSVEDVQRVARERIRPDETTIMIVGPWAEISAGNTDSEADPNRVVTMDEIGHGTVTRIPNRDPLTLEPLPED